MLLLKDARGCRCMTTDADLQPERCLHAVPAVCTCLSAARMAERRASLRSAAARMAARAAQQRPQGIEFELKPAHLCTTLAAGKDMQGKGTGIEVDTVRNTATKLHPSAGAPVLQQYARRRAALLWLPAQAAFAAAVQPPAPAQWHLNGPARVTDRHVCTTSARGDSRLLSRRLPDCAAATS
jgi:hypothetical protein